MIREAIARNVGFWLMDRVTGSQVQRYYNLYKIALSWDRERIRKYQFGKIRMLLDHAYNSVPFYRARFEKFGLTPSSVRSLHDFARLPVLTRDDLRDHTQELLSDTFHRNGAHRCSSSGTTGVPIVYFKDVSAISADIAATYLMWELAGCYVGERRLHIWGTPGSSRQWKRLGSRLKRGLFNARYFPAGSLDDDESHRTALELLNSYKPDFVDGYTSSIYSIARFAQEHDILVHHPNVVLTTAENLLSYQRDTIESILGPVRDVYGCGEINGVAVECVERNYHIIEPRVYVEYEDSPAENGGKKLILTDLDNFVMPFIRYEVGDMVGQPVHTKTCACGLKSTFFRGINGRTSELVNFPNGMVVSPVTVFGGAAFRAVRNFRKHQTIWNGKYLIFTFEVTDDFTDTDKMKLESIIEGLVQRYSVDFRLRITREIPNNGVKFNYFKNDYEAV